MTVSIVIPYFNAAHIVLDTLKSVVAQSQPPHQIICVNDGSTDHSERVVKQFTEQHPNLNWIHISQGNKGLGAARNAALPEVTGEYIAWLDADDTYNPDTLSHISKHHQSGAKWLTWAAWEWDGKKSFRKRFWRICTSVSDMLLNGNPFLPSATMLKTKIAQTFPFCENRNMHGAEDIDLWIRLMRANILPIQINQRLTNYRIHAEGMSQHLEKHLQSIKNVIDVYNIDAHTKEKALYRKYYEMARVSQRRGDHKQASTYYIKSQANSLKGLLLKLTNYLKLRI